MCTSIWSTISVINLSKIRHLVPICSIRLPVKLIVIILGELFSFLWEQCHCKGLQLFRQLVHMEWCEIVPFTMNANKMKQISTVESTYSSISTFLLAGKRTNLYEYIEKLCRGNIPKNSVCFWKSFHRIWKGWRISEQASKQTEEEKIGIQSIEITKESLKWDIEVCSFYSQSHGNNSLGPFSRRESQSVQCSFPLFAFVLSSNIQAFFAFDSYSICIEVRHFFSK